MKARGMHQSGTGRPAAARIITAETQRRGEKHENIHHGDTEALRGKNEQWPAGFAGASLCSTRGGGGHGVGCLRAAFGGYICVHLRSSVAIWIFALETKTDVARPLRLPCRHVFGFGRRATHLAGT